MRRVFVMLAAMGLLLAAGSARAASTYSYFAFQNGDYAVGMCWYPQGVVPGAGYIAAIGDSEQVPNGCTVTLTSDVSSHVPDALSIGDDVAATLALSGSANLNIASLYVGNTVIYYPSAGAGTLTIDAGTLTNGGDAYLGYASGSVGAVTLNNGTWTNGGNVYVGYVGSGAYTQTGGAANFSGDLSGSGACNLSGGALNMNAHNVSVASLNFSGGTLTNAGTISSNMTLGSTSTGTVFQQSSGSATVVSGTISGVGGLTKTGLGTLDFSNATLNYAGTTTIAAGTLRTSITSLISLLGGSATTAVNVQSNTSKLLIDYTGFESYKSLYDGAMQSILQTSYNSAGGHFASGMIYSPTATAAGNALGWSDNASTSLITVAYTLYGDANLDGVVNGADLGAVLANFGSTNGTWYMGDFNYDGSVNGADLGVVLANFSQHISATAVVPEPSTMLLVYVSLLSLLAFAFRKNFCQTLALKKEIQ